MKDRFEPRDYLAALTVLREQVLQAQPSLHGLERTHSSPPLTPYQLDLCLSLVRIACELLNRSGQLQEPPSGLTVYLPDRAGHLLTSSSLTFDDAPWISAALSNKSSILFVHRGVAAQVCLIPTLVSFTHNPVYHYYGFASYRP